MLHHRAGGGRADGHGGRAPAASVLAKSNWSPTSPQVVARLKAMVEELPEATEEDEEHQRRLQVRGGLGPYSTEAALALGFGQI